MTSNLMWRRFERQLRWFDQKYNDAHKVWKDVQKKRKKNMDAWEKSDKDEDEKPVEPEKKFDSSAVRSFKYLPLFKKVKI